MERKKAFELLKKYDEENFHIQYALTVEEVMKWYANKLGYDADYWGIIGLLHDLGYEVYPQEHYTKIVEILKTEGYGEDVIHAICSHAYNIMVDTSPNMKWRKFSMR